MIRERIEQLRKLMKEKNLSAYILPSADPHLSEYLPNYYKSREWISGFNGSAGTVVITTSKAGLWVDSRYYIQGAQQTEGSGIELFKMGLPKVPTYTKWLDENINENEKVGFDGSVFSVNGARNLEKALENKKIEIVSEYDLISPLWKDRPALTTDPIFSLDPKYAGKSRIEKFEEVRKEMKKRNIDNHLICSLDDIAWLFNIRGNDIAYNPVVVSYALISKEKNYLFIDERKITCQMKDELESDGVVIMNYSSVQDTLASLNEDESILLKPAATNKKVFDSIKKGMKIVEDAYISTIMKAKKNETEVENIRRVMLKDGVAMVKFLCWLDNTIGNEKITEISASDKLEEFRRAQENNKGLSFGTISAYGEHAALCHYSSTPETDVELKQSGLYLLDSGGQYLEGTTDITRTIVMGDLTDEEKTDYTLVLKGHIGLALAKFPTGTKGVQLDLLARQPLWEHGTDFGHGTGHGVGFFLGVHEGPQNIGTGMNTIPFEEGMLTSNEPGIYKEGRHGVRIESLILTVEDKETEFGKFYKFETVTLCPIDIRGIDKSLMTEEEISFLNEYHKRVNKELSPLLDEDEKKWLDKMTAAI
jgi:Xaa-Pro aminopeptidase